jgi:hypothetical protein
MIMEVELDKDAVARVFSYQKIRDFLLVKAQVLTIIDVFYTAWGEEVTTYAGLPALITSTHWGDTPFKKALKNVMAR